MENTTGKTVTVELQNLALDDFVDPDGSFPRWPDIEPVYSYNTVAWQTGSARECFLECDRAELFDYVQTNAG